MKYLPYAAVWLLLAACNNAQKERPVQQDAPATDTSKYTLEMVDSNRDVVCHMPLKYGIEDTVHYKGRVYGFCSEECRNDFLKNPDSLLAKKE